MLAYYRRVWGELVEVVGEGIEWIGLLYWVHTYERLLCDKVCAE